MARPLSETARASALAAASEVLKDSGVDGFTVDEVARRSGVAKSTIYRHFSSSNELMLYALECHVVPLPQPNTGNLRSDLMAFAAASAENMNDEALPRIFLGVLSRAVNDPELAKVHQAFINEQRKPMRSIIEAAMSRGEIHESLDTDLALDLTIGPFLTRRMTRFLPLDEASLTQLIDLIVAALTNYEPTEEPRATD